MTLALRGCVAAVCRLPRVCFGACRALPMRRRLSNTVAVDVRLGVTAVRRVGVPAAAAAAASNGPALVDIECYFYLTCLGSSMIFISFARLKGLKNHMLEA